MNEEEALQNRIYDNNSDEFEKNDLGNIAYMSLFQALPKLEEYSVPTDLADVVMKKIEERQKRSLLRQDFFWFWVGIFLLLYGGVYAAIKTEFKIEFGFIDGFAYKGVLLFGICFIAALNYLDRFIRRKRFIA